MDLAPELYRQLQQCTTDLAEILGRTRVPAVAVMRALLTELLADDALHAKVVNRLREDLDTIA